MTWAFTGLLLGLAVLYMTRPRYSKRRVSSARFFTDLPPPRTRKSHWRLALPETDRHFWIQLTALLLLLLAVIMGAKPLFKRTVENRPAIWMWIDTSASMTAGQAVGQRVDALHREADRVLTSLRNWPDGLRPVLRISAFDLERRDILQTDAALPVSIPTGRLEPRLLGTDLNLIRAAMATADDFVATHFVVLSDQPAPSWADDLVSAEGPVLIWRHVGTPVDNAGIANIEAWTDPLTNAPATVRISLQAYGSPPATAQLRISDPSGALIHQSTPTWQAGNLWQIRFQPTQSGLYQINLIHEDAYPIDNRATIDILTGSNLQVEWRLPQNSWPGFLGWEQNHQDAQVRITDRFEDARSDIPTLIVGNGARQAEVTVYDFSAASPLMDQLNLDAFEASGLTGQAIPEAFQPVLRTSETAAVLAIRRQPRAVFVPALPQWDAEGLQMQRPGEKVTATLFFNGLRLCLSNEQAKPLLSLTTPAQPQPQGNRLALHPDEGNTAMALKSQGWFGEQNSGRVGEETVPWWPLLLLLAALCFWVDNLIK